jgi:predicted translation initiation factor SUI1
MSMKDKLVGAGLVFSTDPNTQKKIETPALPALNKNAQVRVGRETKGRSGSGVTVIHGLPLKPDALAELAKTLKKRCGSGGTVRDGVIEIQGEHRDVIAAELSKLGYAAKKAGH